jgi:antitoxin CcdA
MRSTPRTKTIKQTVSLTINSEVFARAKALRINASQIAEDALAREVSRVEAAQVKAEILQDLAASNAYIDRHGSFADLVRAHYESDDD